MDQLEICNLGGLGELFVYAFGSVFEVLPLFDYLTSSWIVSVGNYGHVVRRLTRRSWRWRKSQYQSAQVSFD